MIASQMQIRNKNSVIEITFSFDFINMDRPLDIGYIKKKYWYI